MAEVTVRPIKDEQELETVYRVWETAFPEEKHFFESRLQCEDEYNLGTTWVAAADGEIGAAVQIFPYQAWMDDVQVKVAGIGNVATLPQYRGRGLTHAILREQVAWMRKHEYDLSLLYTGIPAFYEKAGWHTVEEAFYTLPLKSIHLPTKPSFTYVVANFTEQELGGVREVYRMYNKHRTGTRIRTEQYWQKLIKRIDRPCFDLLVAKKSGRVVAYVWTSCIKENLREMQVQEMCYVKGEEEAALLLLKEIAERNPAVESVRMSVPASHVLARTFGGQGASREKNSEAMWRTINEKAFLTKVTVLLTKRIQNEKRMFTQFISDRLVIRMAGGDTQLVITGEGVEIGEDSRSQSYANEIEVTEGEWLRMILQGAQNVENEKIRENVPLHMLFPEQNSILWLPDRF